MLVDRVSKDGRSLGAVALGLAALFVLASGILLLGQLAYTPDSWTFYELSQSFGGDFYRTGHLRSFGEHGYQNASFPPLWPALIAGFDAITGAGPKAAFYLAILAFIPFAILSEASFRSLFGVRLAGLAIALVTFSHAGFRSEIVGGRSISVQMLLYAAALWLFSRDRKVSPPIAAAIGVCMGLSLLNRFDALPLVIALAVSIAILSRSWLSLISYIAAALLAASPWIYYSLTRFGSFFATDGGGVGLMADRAAYVTDWWPAPQPTVFDLPLLWLEKVLANLTRLPSAFLASPGIVGLALIVLAMGLFAWALIRQRKGQIRAPLRKALGDFTDLIIFVAPFFALLSSYVMTGWFDARYFAPLWWILVFTASGIVISALPPAPARRIAAAALLLVVLTSAALTAARQVALPSASRTPAASFGKLEMQIRTCLPGIREREAVMIFNSTYAGRLSAMNGWRTVENPRNIFRLRKHEVEQFLDRFGVHYVVAETPREARFLRETVGLGPVSGCPPFFFDARPGDGK